MKTAPFSAHTYDLAIIGGGVVGASLAIAAGDSGFDTLLIDSNPLKSSTSDIFDGRAFSISIGCWRMWRVSGVTDVLEKTAQPIVGVQAESELGRRLIIDQSDTNTAEEPLGYMVEHRHIQRTLDEALAARDSITVRRGAPLTHLDVANGVVRVGSSDFRAEARIIVGCDGANSAVRSASGIRLHGHDYAATALAASVQLENDHQGAARQVFLKTGPLAVLPLPDNRANIIWTEPKDTAETLEAMRDQDFEAELRLRAGDFIGPFELIGHRFAYPLSLRMVESFTADRVALAGDAAHVIHPLAGQGVNLGLKDVAALVETIADARQVGLDIGAETALDPYNRWRRFDTLAMASATEGLARVFRAARPIRSLAGVGMGLSGRMAGLRHAMAAEAGGVFGDLPRLMRGEPVR